MEGRAARRGRTRGAWRIGIEVVVVLFACTPSDSAEEGTLHPRPEFSVRSGPPAFVVSTDPPADASDPSVTMGRAAFASNAAGALRIGTFDAPAGEVFGQVQDAVVDERGRVALLDAQAKELRVFDARGGLMAVLGGPGMGPGQFRAPKAVGLGPHGECDEGSPGSCTTQQCGPGGPCEFGECQT